MSALKTSVGAVPVKMAEAVSEKLPAELTAEEIKSSVSQAMASGNPPGQLPFGGSIKALEVVKILADAVNSPKPAEEQDSTAEYPGKAAPVKEKSPAKAIITQVALNPEQDIEASRPAAMIGAAEALPRLNPSFQAAVEQVAAFISKKQHSGFQAVKTGELPLVEETLAASGQAQEAAVIASDAASTASETATAASRLVDDLLEKSQAGKAVQAVEDAYEAGKNALQASEAASRAAEIAKAAAEALKAGLKQGMLPAALLKTEAETAKTEALAAAARAKEAAEAANKAEKTLVLAQAAIIITRAVSASEQALEASQAASEAAVKASDAAAAASIQLYNLPKITTLALAVSKEEAGRVVAEAYEAGEKAVKSSREALDASKKLKAVVNALEDEPSEALKHEASLVTSAAYAAARQAKEAAATAEQAGTRATSKAQDARETSAAAEQTISDFTRIDKLPLSEQLFSLDKLVNMYTPPVTRRYIELQKEELIRKHLPGDVPLTNKNNEIKMFIENFKQVSKDSHGFTFKSRISPIIGELENYSDIVSRHPNEAKARLKALEKVITAVKNFIIHAGDSVRIEWVKALEQKLEIVTGEEN
jgi:hypothetical protein